MFQKIKGTQDFLDLSLWQFIVKNSSEYLNLHNFNQIKLPAIESVDLFKRSVGLETDIVNKEMFVIAPRTGSSENICLKPEATASTMRAFLENGIQNLPWKVFSFDTLFRYERPQKGRYREFNQCNIEIVGSDCIDQDVALISMLDSLFSTKLKIANYALLLNFLGCQNDRVNFRDVLTGFLQANHSICETCQKRSTTNPLRIFDCKSEDCQAIYQNAPKITNHLCENCAQEWQLLQNHLELLGVSFAVKPDLVRGLDYYNKTVFEFTSAHLGAQSSFCGGGRYELASALGNKTAVPAIGAAFGMERVLLILEQIEQQLILAQKPALTVIIPLSPAQNMLALLVAQNLSQHNVPHDLILEDASSVKSKMRKANKLGPIYCVLIGEQEQASNSVLLKNMMSGHEQLIKQIDLVNILKN